MPVEYESPSSKLIERIADLVQRHPEASVAFSGNGGDCYFALSIHHPRALPALEAALSVVNGANAPGEDALVRAHALLTYHQEAWAEGYEAGQARALDDAFEQAQQKRDPELTMRVLNRIEELERRGTPA